MQDRYRHLDENLLQRTAGPYIRVICVDLGMSAAWSEATKQSSSVLFGPKLDWLFARPVYGLHFGRSNEIVEPIEPNLPDGQITSDFQKSCQAPYSKIFLLSRLTQISSLIRTVPCPTRGALRTSRNAGRDAVDAAASGEQERAGRMMLTRTAKSCGSDAPMLASSLREEAQATVSNKPGHRGEHEVSRKTIARGMPGDFRCDRGDYARVLFSFRTRGCGCIGRPAFPAPSDFRRRE